MKNGKIMVENWKVLYFIDHLFLLIVPAKFQDCGSMALKTFTMSQNHHSLHLQSSPSSERETKYGITIDLSSLRLAPGIIFLCYFLPVNPTALCSPSQGHQTVFILLVWLLSPSIILRFTCFVTGMTNKNSLFLRSKDIPLLSTEQYLPVHSLVGISVVSTLLPLWP